MKIRDAGKWLETITVCDVVHVVEFGRAWYKTVINWCQVLSVPSYPHLVGWGRITWWGWTNQRVSGFTRGERGQTQTSVFLVNIGILAELRNTNNASQDNTYGHIIVNFKIDIKTIIEYWILNSDRMHSGDFLFLSLLNEATGSVIIDYSA